MIGTRPQVLYTIGHGNRPLDELVGLLERAGVACLVDVRAHPGSRRHPQFGRGALEVSLPAAGIGYIWEGEALGGRRRPQPESPHRALRNESFRAYADHMESEGFRSGVERLLALAAQAPVALMCAERLPWQCHRFMIADYLVAHAVRVVHLIDSSKPREHRLRAEARLSEGRLVYDGGLQLELPRA